MSSESQVVRLKRSLRAMLERDGHDSSPGTGKLALVLARAGTGKTAFLTTIGLDAIFSGKRVLHVDIDTAVDKVRTWYDDLLAELLSKGDLTGNALEMQLLVERARHIHTYGHHSFSVAKIQETLELMDTVMHFDPQVILVDGMDLEKTEARTVAQLRELAQSAGAELWITCRVRRDGPPTRPGHLPPPADQFETLADLAFLLEHEGARVRLHVLKEHEQIGNVNTHVLLDANSLLMMGE
jgi:hypothetical protein